MQMNGTVVLVVDDDPDIRGLVQAILESDLSVHTLPAANGREALRVLSEQQVALVVTDVNMPYMDGTDLIRRLRGCSPTRSLPVLVVAASQTAREEAMPAGGSDYLDKPFDLSDLAGKVQERLALPAA